MPENEELSRSQQESIGDETKDNKAERTRTTIDTYEELIAIDDKLVEGDVLINGHTYSKSAPSVLGSPPEELPADNGTLRLRATGSIAMDRLMHVASVETGGSITAPYGLESAGDIKAGNNIVSLSYINAGGNIEAGGYMQVDGRLTAQGSVKAGEELDLGSDLTVGGDLVVGKDLKIRYGNRSVKGNEAIGGKVLLGVPAAEENPKE